MKPTSPAKTEKIMRLFREGLDYIVIAERVGMPYSMVVQIIKRLENVRPK